MIVYAANDTRIFYADNESSSYDTMAIDAKAAKDASRPTLNVLQPKELHPRFDQEPRSGPALMPKREEIRLAESLARNRAYHMYTSIFYSIELCPRPPNLFHGGDWQSV